MRSTATRKHTYFSDDETSSEEERGRIKARKAQALKFRQIQNAKNPPVIPLPAPPPESVPVNQQPAETLNDAGETASLTQDIATASIDISDDLLLKATRKALKKALNKELKTAIRDQSEDFVSNNIHNQMIEVADFHLNEAIVPYRQYCKDLSKPHSKQISQDSVENKEPPSFGKREIVPTGKAVSSYAKFVTLLLSLALYVLSSNILGSGTNCIEPFQKIIYCFISVCTTIFWTVIFVMLASEEETFYCLLSLLAGVATVIHAMSLAPRIIGAEVSGGFCS